MTISCGSRLAKLTVAAVFLVRSRSQALAATEAQADQRETPDGLTISAQEWATVRPESCSSRFLQSYLSGASGHRTSLENSHRTYDLRGPRYSDKPLDPRASGIPRPGATRSRR